MCIHSRGGSRRGHYGSGHCVDAGSGRLFARLDAIARPEAVLASNTSGSSITAIALRCGLPERVRTTHFWNPAHVMPLVEVVQGDRTSPEAAEAVMELLAACGKKPVG
jgi:3-hydroxybutyryl-CoA dehydrogenase